MVSRSTAPSWVLRDEEHVEQPKNAAATEAVDLFEDPFLESASRLKLKAITCNGAVIVALPFRPVMSPTVPPSGLIAS